MLLENKSETFFDLAELYTLHAKRELWRFTAFMLSMPMMRGGMGMGKRRMGYTRKCKFVWIFIRFKTFHKWIRIFSFIFPRLWKTLSSQRSFVSLNGFIGTETVRVWRFYLTGKHSRSGKKINDAIITINTASSTSNIAIPQTLEMFHPSVRMSVHISIRFG